MIEFIETLLSADKCTIEKVISVWSKEKGTDNKMFELLEMLKDGHCKEVKHANKVHGNTLECR